MPGRDRRHRGPDGRPQQSTSELWSGLDLYWAG